jgi:hypothetical protein
VVKNISGDDAKAFRPLALALPISLRTLMPASLLAGIEHGSSALDDVRVSLHRRTSPSSADIV